MHRPIFLHIGLHKTGTSSIQHYLAKRRALLRRRSIVVPVSVGEKNHYNLALFAGAADAGALRLNHGLVSKSAMVEFRKSFLEALRVEAASWTEQDTIVLSSEHLSSLRDPGEFDRLKEVLATLGPRPVRIVVYLRRQDSYYVSAYAQYIKGGSTAAWLSEESFDQVELDYARLLTPWRDAFGGDSLCVRVFEPSQLAGGDSVVDFMSVIGCHDVVDFQVMRNVSLDARSTEFLRRINPWVPRFTENGPNPRRRALLNALGRMPAGPQLRLGRETAMRILARYEESNARIAKRYLGRADGRLFHELPVDHPEQAPALSIDDALEISAQLWTIAYENAAAPAGDIKEGKTRIPEEEKKRRKALRLASMTPAERMARRETRGTRGSGT